jgi:hypothetical protein
MTTLLRKAATVATALSIAGGGIAGIAGASSISNTGFSSDNKVNQNTRVHQDVDNDNHFGVRNFNCQLTATGDAKATKNTEGGSATSGNASATNSTTTSVAITNTTPAVNLGGAGGSGDNSIDMTGADSNNTINNNTTVHMDVNNDNSVWVSNTNLQGSFSGNATTSKNTSGGDATSGNASATNSTTTSITIVNQ